MKRLANLFIGLSKGRAMQEPNMANGANAQKRISWLVFFFGLAYFCQHFAQTQTALLAQPINYFCKEALGWGPTKVEVFLSVLIIPWTIKPLYGLISDFIPLFGLRRKSYLLILNTIAALGFLAVANIADIYVIRTALLICAVGTAASDVIVDGLMVELGKKTGMTARFQSQQWLWFNVAAVLTALGGGYLSEWFEPAHALSIAAYVTAIAPAIVVIATWLLVYEDRSQFNLVELKSTTGNLFQALRSKTLWIVAAFLAFWQFRPSFGSPFYYHQTDALKFSQEFIGQLTAISCAGSVIGVLAYGRWLETRFTTKNLMYISVVLGVLSTLAYLLLIDPTTTATPLMAIIVNGVTGATNIVAFLTTLALAAQVCPKRVEALTFSVLMSVFNIAQKGSSVFGAYLYEDMFNNSLSPLIWVSALFTAACFVLVPLLPNTKKDET